jgi:hypothetical protein
VHIFHVYELLVGVFKIDIVRILAGTLESTLYRSWGVTTGKLQSPSLTENGLLVLRVVGIPRRVAHCVSFNASFWWWVECPHLVDLQIVDRSRSLLLCHRCGMAYITAQRHRRPR